MSPLVGDRLFDRIYGGHFVPTKAQCSDLSTSGTLVKVQENNHHGHESNLRLTRAMA